MYPYRTAPLPICKIDEEYLLLRLDKQWKFCPGDWDFVLGTVQDERKPLVENAILNTKTHTGLSGSLIREYPVLYWNDHESLVTFVLYPCLINVNSRSFELSSKFCEAKWMSWDNVLQYDRNEYLFTVLRHIDINGGI